MKSTHVGMSAYAVSQPAEIEDLRRFQAERYVSAGLADCIGPLVGPDPLADRSTWFVVRGPSGQLQPMVVQADGSMHPRRLPPGGAPPQERGRSLTTQRPARPVQVDTPTQALRG